MKICAISDTHGQIVDVPECDILLHCGDISPMVDHSFYNQQQYLFDSFIPWLKILPAKHIVFIGGNHDFFLWETYKSKMEGRIHNALPKNMHYLRDSEVQIEGVRIYGTPWVPVLVRWAFYLSDDEAKERYASMPLGLDILLSHGPPKNSCDTILEYGDDTPLGSRHLRDRILEAQPRVVFCGHIHSGSHEWDSPMAGCPTKVRNVSVLDESYKKAYEPFVFEYER